MEVDATGGKKRNKGVEVSSDPGFRSFYQKRVDVRQCEPCRNLGDKSRGRKTRKEEVEERDH